MTTYTTSKAAELARRLAEKEAELQRERDAIRAEQEAEDKTIDDALARAGRARVALVEDLLDMFGIEPAAPEPRRNKRTGEILRDRDGRPKTVDPDPDEALRMQRLRAAIEELVAAAPSEPKVTAAEYGGHSAEPVETDEEDSLDDVLRAS
ncbi:hypothetical protein [Rothia koreensis]|jgi:hypothetical protein|nr:hypothetical protein [Rothia koreensis]